MSALTTCRRSPCWSRSHCRFCSTPGRDRLSRMRTLRPEDSRRWARLQPMKPAPPVIRVSCSDISAPPAGMRPRPRCRRGSYREASRTELRAGLRDAVDRGLAFQPRGKLRHAIVQAHLRLVAQDALRLGDVGEAVADVP